MSRHERAESLANKAMCLMAERRIAPTPENFELFYAYCAGESPEAARQIGEMLTACKTFTPAALVELREKFFGKPDAAQSAAAISLKVFKALDAVMARLQTAGEDTAAYGKTLSAVTGELGGEGAPADLRALVDSLLIATQAMENRAQDLECELNRTSGEMNDLRGKLEIVRRESLTDPLTAIANRKSFDMELLNATEHAMKTGEPLSVLMCDIDKFKVFNDTWGHQTGDQVLRLVAGCLSESVHGRDTAARYGGEEFGVILPRTSLADASALADHIRMAVQARKLIKKSSGDVLGTITISIGVAQFARGENAGTVVQRADACLYAAKRAGRNCVIGETHPQANVAA